MKSALKIMIGLMLAAMVVFVMSCGGIGGGGGGDQDDDYGGGGQDIQEFTFDISGAKAIAGFTSSARTLSSGSKGVRAVSDQIVKIMENGTVESILDFPDDGGGWQPSVAFIAIGDDDSVYICFDWPYYQWGWDEETQTDINHVVQFIRVYPDNSHEVIWPTDPYDFDENTDGRVETWSWWGMDAEPLVKDDEGNLYFKVTKGGSTSTDHIYMYDPVTGGEPTLRTPANASLQIQNFKVDSQGHLFIKSYDWGGDSNYLRYYTPGFVQFENIYYSSSSDNMWVRGYITSPDGNSVIINGYNIRGMNGIIRANLPADPVNDDPEMELLYANAGGGGTWIWLSHWSDDGWQNGTELIEEDAGAGWSDPNRFYWMDEVLDTGSPADALILNRVASYFYGTVTFKTGVSAATLDTDFTKTVHGFQDGIEGDYSEWDNVYDASWDIINDPWDTTYWNNWGTAHRIYQDPERWLTETFDGTLFKDWLAANNMDQLNFDFVGNMLWASDGALYGLYEESWWGGSTSSGTKVLKLLDANGNLDLQVVNLQNGDKFPTKLKIIGDYLYYRYAILDSYGQETGTHKLARYDIVNDVEEELLDFPDISAVEILGYDASDDNSIVYFSALDYNTNEVMFGKVDPAAGTWEKIEADAIFDTIKVF